MRLLLRRAAARILRALDRVAPPWRPPPRPREIPPMPFIVRWVIATGVLALAATTGCGSGPPYTPADRASDVNTVKLAAGCELLCLSDGGCSPDQAAACLDAIACNAGSSLHRHGGPDLIAPDAGCR